MKKSTLALDLDPLDLMMAVLIPIYGLGAGVMLCTDRSLRREGLVLLAISVVTALVLALVAAAG